MPTLADLFKTCYLTGGSGVEFSAIRLHYRGVDEICRAFASAVRRRFGVPSPNIKALRNG